MATGDGRLMHWGWCWWMLGVIVSVSELSLGASRYCGGHERSLRLIGERGPLLAMNQCANTISPQLLLHFSRQPRVLFSFDPQPGNYSLLFVSVKNRTEVRPLWKVTNIKPVGRDLTKNGTTVKPYESPDVSRPGRYQFIFWVSKQDKNQTGVSLLPPLNTPPIAAFEFYYQTGDVATTPGPKLTTSRPTPRGFPKITVKIKPKHYSNGTGHWNKGKKKKNGAPLCSSSALLPLFLAVVLTFRNRFF